MLFKRLPFLRVSVSCTMCLVAVLAISSCVSVPSLPQVVPPSPPAPLFASQPLTTWTLDDYCRFASIITLVLTVALCMATLAIGRGFPVLLAGSGFLGALVIAYFPLFVNLGSVLVSGLIVGALLGGVLYLFMKVRHLKSTQRTVQEDEDVLPPDHGPRK